MTRPSPSSEAGFTLATVMIAMLVVVSLTAAAFAATNGDIRLGQRNVDSKRAYGAAEAGIAYYLQKLGQDNDYWTRCTNDPKAPVPNPVGQVSGSTPAAERGWRALPTDARAEYTIELLPQRNVINARCIENDNESMIDPAQGTLRVRSTGRTNGVYRTVVATLRRNGFLDFLYFTDFETSDPALQILAQPQFNYDGRNFWRGVGLKRLPPAQARTDTSGVTDTVEAWAAKQEVNPDGTEERTCSQWLRPSFNRKGRAATGRYEGSAFFDLDEGGKTYGPDWNSTSVTGSNNIRCSTIQFRGPEEIKGPFHSNDHICVTNNPVFGRAGEGDRIEFYGYNPDCEQSADLKSTPLTGSNLGILSLPETNGRLKETASTPYRFFGRTTFVLSGATMTVTRSDNTTSTMPLPLNGLIYVENSPTLPCNKFNADDPTPVTGSQGCGDAYVRGTYSKSLTIAARRDVVVTEDITAVDGSDALLGLIGQNYVRVAHRVTSSPCDANTADAAGQDKNRTIQAAILSLQHVFTVDNYHCGDPLEKLTVKGAIGQKFRGAVGTSSGTTSVSGYVKDYEYDERLLLRSPPYFITPAQSAWRVLRSTEQSPATRP